MVLFNAWLISQLKNPLMTIFLRECLQRVVAIFKNNHKKIVKMNPKMMTKTANKLRKKKSINPMIFEKFVSRKIWVTQFNLLMREGRSCFYLLIQLFQLVGLNLINASLLKHINHVQELNLILVDKQIKLLKESRKCWKIPFT